MCLVIVIWRKLIYFRQLHFSFSSSSTKNTDSFQSFSHLTPFLSKQNSVICWLVFSQTWWLRYVWLMAWQIRLSVCRLWRVCTLLRGVNFSGIFLHYIVAWPSGNSLTKNHEGRLRGSPAQREINRKGVVKQVNLAYWLASPVGGPSHYRYGTPTYSIQYSIWNWNSVIRNEQTDLTKQSLITHANCSNCTMRLPLTDPLINLMDSGIYMYTAVVIFWFSTFIMLENSVDVWRTIFLEWNRVIWRFACQPC